MLFDRQIGSAREKSQEGWGSGGRFFRPSFFLNSQITLEQYNIQNKQDIMKIMNGTRQNMFLKIQFDFDLLAVIMF